VYRNNVNGCEANRKRLRFRKHQRTIITIILAVGDLLIINLAFLLGYFLRFYHEIGVQAGWVRRVPVAPPEMYLQLLILVNTAFLLVFSLLRMYKRDRARWMLDELHSTWRALNIGYLFLATITFFIRTEEFQYSRLVLLYAYGLSMILVPAFRLVVLKAERWFHARGAHNSNVLIIGSSEMARIVARKLQTSPHLGYRVSGICCDVSERSTDIDDVSYLGAPDQFETILLRYAIDEVFISDANISHFKLLEIVSVSERMGVNVKMVPTVYDLLIDFADMNDLDGLPLVAIREQPMYELSLWGKRLFDILFASGVLILTFPICVIIAILIKIDSKGPLFFSQIRAGVGGKPFRMYKFRSMFPDAEQRLNELIDLDTLEEPVFKLEKDPRITRVGYWLRRMSLDEIPQFWNVIKGDMSVVGPRPEETQLVDKYNIWQQRRLKAKPGITGMQQVMCRGTTSLSDRIKFDIYYLRKHSLLLDIWIILKTLPVVISGRGAR